MIIELTETRVYRTYIGGKLLDEFNNNENPKDGFYPERWICSTTSAPGGEGLSKTADGVPLTDLINKPVDILVKLLDSYTRLMIQVHPNDEQAQKYFNWQTGKTEAWYIMGTRVIDGVEPYVYLGFKEDVTREKWEEVFYKQDIDEMQNCMHRVNVKPGDVFYIPANAPHAMGSGVFFAEIQQPTDITLRTEKFSQDGREMSMYDLTHDATYEEMFNCFDYNGANLEDTLKKYKVEKQGETVLETEMFSMYEVDVETSRVIEPNPYALIIVLEGEDKGREIYIDEPYEFTGKQKLLVCYGDKK